MLAGRGRPFLTYYDDTAGERVELSYATFDNWVAKTANWLRDDRGVAAGDAVTVDRPDHWLGVVAAFAAWRIGARVEAGGAAVTIADVADEVLVHGDTFAGAADLPDGPAESRRLLVTRDVLGAALAAYRGGGSVVFGTFADADRVAEAERAAR